jgi:flagellar biosynthesis/type III secretory pathway M-ring protein FliF/YscJ
MDLFPSTIRQLMDRFREMSLIQRATSITFVLAVSFGFVGLVFFKSPGGEQPVSYGKSFGADELESAERALVAAGLTQFRRDGLQLLAPKKDLDRYNAALLEFDALPADLGTQMLKQYETMGPFSTDRQRQQMKEALLLKELRRMIKAVPDIQDARVAVASPERKVSWNQRPRVTANVTITPRTGREISFTLVQSLRHVVASMVPDLKPSDVTIFDVNRGQVYTGEAVDDGSDDRYLNRIREITRHYEQQILKALSHIPKAGVVVQIDLDRSRAPVAHSETVRSREQIAGVANRSAAITEGENHLTGFRGSVAGPLDPDLSNDEAELVASAPKEIRVSISIPRDYVRKVAIRQSSRGSKSSVPEELASVEEDVVSKIERIVSRMLPRNSTGNVISVTCVDQLDEDSPAIGLARWKDLTAKQSSLTAGAIVLGVLILFFLVMPFQKSGAPKYELRGVVAGEGFDGNSVEQISVGSTNGLPPMDSDGLVTLRDEIRLMIQSDPVTSAELLGRWLSEADQ